MKTSAIFAGTALAAFLCSGCVRVGQSGQSEMKAPVMEEDDTISILACESEGDLTVYDAIGDKITTMSQEIIMKYSEFHLPEGLETKDVEEKISSTVKGLYKDLNGVSASCTFREDRVIVKVVVDFDQADMDLLIAKGLIEEGEVQNKYVSLKKTKEILEGDNQKCTLKESQ